MQLFLPIFREKTKMINFKLGFQRIDDFVLIFVNGLPVYFHAINDKNCYRYIIPTLINNKLCSITELSEAYGVLWKNIEK